jgi:Tfp pilus assembly protein PilF
VFYSQVPGKEAEAEKYFETAIKQNPNNASIFTNYAKFLHQQKRIPKAEELCNKATEVDKNYVPAYELHATILEEQQKLKEAAIQLRKALEADPTDYARWIRTGYLELNSGQENNAVEAFLEGIKRNEYDQKLTVCIISNVFVT